MWVEPPRLSRVEAVLAIGIIVLITESDSDIEMDALDTAMDALGVAPDQRPALRSRLAIIARNAGGVGLIGAAQKTLRGPDVEYACELISRTLLPEEPANQPNSILTSLKQTLLAS